ncbi:MAG: chitobiase/beta-hexosaminidase C-terminal domain-containing protein [bacterium]
MMKKINDLVRDLLLSGNLKHETRNWFAADSRKLKTEGSFYWKPETRNLKLLLLVFAVFLFAALPSLSFAAWTIESVDAPKYFEQMSPRSIAIEKTTNRPHIAYGGDHLYHAYYDGTQWRYEIIDNSPSVGKYASIAIDSNNKVHISYYDYVNRSLKYATNLSGSWVISEIDSYADAGLGCSIALDSNDKVHISYMNWVIRSLKYATNASGAWITATVDSSVQVGDTTSLAIDSSNGIHISYHDSTNQHLKYATNTSGSWVTSTVDSAYLVGGWSSIAIDSNKKIHISCRDYGNDDLKYVTNTSGAWVATTLDSMGQVGIYTSLAIDSTNKVHIGYYDFTNGDLKYITNVTGAWVRSIIDSAGNVGVYPSIIIDSSNKVHISYGGQYSGDLKYTTNVSGSWVISTVDHGSNEGRYNSIAVDSNNKIHISYSGNNNLRYATDASGAWVTSTIDSGDDGSYVGLFSSIAVDSNNKVYISYQDYPNRGLKYATNASDSWTTSTIYPNGGSYTSIALDSNNKVHISFENNGLKYITNISGAWTVTSIDSPQIGATSIAIDSNNKVHISYYDRTNLDLKYATNVSGSWVNYVIDSSEDKGEGCAIALDSNDKVHISYRDRSSHKLRYATNMSGSWVTSIIESIEALQTSIAVDENNKVHIGYLNYVNGDLKYATNVSGLWTTSTVDSIGIVGWYPSIVLDKNNIVHISYYDYGNEDLKHAFADTIPPITTALPQGGIYNSAQSVTLSCNDDTGSGCNATYYCYGSDCTPTTAYSGVITISSSTSLRFYSLDIAGNSEQTKTEIYTIAYAVTPSAGAGGSISPSTPQTVNHGSTTSFTITPDAGYHIVSVAGCGGTLSGNTYTTGPITADCSVSAIFAIDTYTVTPSAGAGGSISPSTPQTVNHGSATSFTVTPDAGYHIVSVTGCGGTLSGNTYTTGPITADCSVSAIFAIDTYTVTPSAGAGGSISPSTPQTVEYNSTISFTIIPDPGYHIADVIVDGSSIGAVTTYTFTNIISSHTIAAQFAIDTYTLDITPSGTGIGTVTSSPSGIDCGLDCTEDYPQGTVVTLSANPDAGSTFTGWSGGGCSGMETCQVTMNADMVIIATFNGCIFQNCQDCHANMTDTASHALHLGADARGTSMSCTDCHSGDKLEDPCLPCTRVFADDEPLVRTAVCDSCHGPDGVFDGSDDPVIGAKANWPGGVYQQPDGLELKPGLENWCAGCHDNGSAACAGVSAPNVMGDNSTYGYNITGHRITCTACHKASMPHIDGRARTYSHDSNPFDPDDSNNYQNGYRLSISMTIPLGVGPLGGSAPERFALCFSCHNYDQIMDTAAPFSTNFQDDGINRHRSHLTAGRYAWDSDWDYLKAPDEIIVDNVQVLFTGDWPSSTAVGGYYGTDYQWHTAGDGTGSATWTALLPQSRDYKVYARWTADTDRANNARYAITYDGGTFTASVDQRTGGGTWTLLGTFFFVEGTSGYVQLSDLADGVVVADAVKFGDPLVESLISCPACHNVHGSPNPAMIRHGELISTPGSSDKVPALHYRWYKADGYTPTIFGQESAYADMPLLGGVGGGTLEESMVCDCCHSGPSPIKYGRTYQALPLPAGSWQRPALPPSIRQLSPQAGSQDVAADRTLRFLLLSNGQDALDWTSFSISLQGDLGYSQTYTDEDAGAVSVSGTSSCYWVSVDPGIDFGDRERITVTVSIQDEAGHTLTPPSWAFTTSLPAIWRTPQGVLSDNLFWMPECLIDDLPETGNMYTPFPSHWVIFDLGQSCQVTHVRLLLSPAYSARLWTISVSDDPDNFGPAVKTNWPAQPDPAGTDTEITAKQGRYLKLSVGMGPLEKNMLLEVDFAAGN